MKITDYGKKDATSLTPLQMLRSAATNELRAAALMLECAQLRAALVEISTLLFDANATGDCIVIRPASLPELALAAEIINAALAEGGAE